MKYFNNCSTEEQAKEAYKSLYKANFSNVVLMAEINSELKQCLQTIAALKKFEEIKPQREALNDDILTYKATFARSLSQNITVEIAGKFIWITGVKREDTGIQARLKSENFRYSGKKNSWWFTTIKNFRTHKHLNMPQIRMKYNAQELTQKEIFN